MYALRSGAGADAVQTLDLVLLRVAETALDPEAVSTQKRPASEANSFAIPASMCGSRARRAGPPQLIELPGFSRHLNASGRKPLR